MNTTTPAARRGGERWGVMANVDLHCDACGQITTHEKSYDYDEFNDVSYATYTCIFCGEESCDA